MTSETQAMGKTLRHLTKTATALYGFMLVLAAAPAGAANPIADGPLFLTVSVAPNVTVTLDDSGSMARAWVPEENCTNGNRDINGCAELTNRYEKAANRNLIHYNPAVTYPLPKKADGTTYTTSFTAAYVNGFNPAEGTVNLSTSYRPTSSIHLRGGDHQESYMPHYSSDVRCNNTSSNMCQIRNASGTWVTSGTSCTGSSDGARNTSCTGGWSTSDDPRNANFLGNNNPAPAGLPAYYYVYDKTRTGCPDLVTDNRCYKIVIVSATSGPVGRVDERQNFANWFSFARTRNLATVTAASVAFADLSSSARVSWQALNSCRGSTGSLLTTACTGWKGEPSVSNSIKPFEGTQRNNFFTWLSQLPTSGSTPLPQAMTRAGEYYRTTGDNSPYDNDLLATSTAQHSCRRNYHIMMTDGIWNAAVTTLNPDGSTLTLPKAAKEGTNTITQYTPMPPYEDTFPNTLADVAFKYWITDLTTLNNNLLPIYYDRSGTFAERVWNPKNDPAEWQHMVNYTIGLGLSGFLRTTNPALTYNGPYGGSYDDLVAGTIDWPQPNSNGADANVADLWHAALNSRGQFFSADDPASLSTAFQSVLTAISGDSGSAASLSANSTSVQPGTSLVYQARFNKDWSGGLIAYPITATSIGTETWDASKKIPAHGARKIFTFDGTKGVPFTQCTNLSASQVTALNTNIANVNDGRCEDRLQWLRGSSDMELRNKRADGKNTFRNRLTTVMGDIINSDPAYVQSSDYGYAALPSGTPGQSGYAAYRSSVANRLPMVYVGSNDGRLYGIRADQNNVDSGVEQFSFIPAGVYANLSRLTDPAYAHRFFVDGGITAGDAYLGTSWKSVVLAGLNAGGKSIFALDVTDPTDFTEKNVMWEFDDKDALSGAASTTLGLTFSQPQIGILENGTWVAVFGNGYNSTSGGAWLYVVDLRTGVLIQKIQASDAAGDESNGLSTPLLADLYDDKDAAVSNRLIDTVYAGDLHGNLWKFDLRGDASAWKVANGAPLFTGEVDDDNDPITPVVRQPITAQPKIAGHPLGGKLVVFGTGRYITSTDPVNTATQTFYGVRDNGETTTARRGNLREQTITSQAAAGGSTVRSISSNDVDWAVQRGFYLDLTEPTSETDLSAPRLKRGERVVSTAIVRAGRAIFTTIIPSTDPCVPGGTSFLMEMSLATGGNFQESILDVNKDGKVDSTDVVGGKVVAGTELDVGMSKTPVILDLDASSDADGDGDPSNDPSYSGFLKLNTGTSGGIDSNLNKDDKCEEGEDCECEAGEDCGEDPPVPGVKRRSWIQIR
jgi:type IV pilus assembly protein PilY1